MLLIGLALPEIAAGEASAAGANAPELVSADSGGDPTRAALPPPTVDLDRLLRLPRSYQASTNRHGGGTAASWRTRFLESSAAAEEVRQTLAAAQAQLENAAATSSQWQLGAPGLGSPDAEHATVSYKLRSQIRQLRDDVVTAEKSHQELMIEADLAGVPQSWRRPEGQVASEGPKAPR